ncbi:hypothetical protein HUT06_42690 [Actinomadura sp. NAK00032]|uniref:hypothetical protein n=1 Tax=Actinomadura sp. NAK00032 TaxID=2742128 RepID=UPI0015929DA0|nr:hypothetical protein [Actinomadura sp. NAK00032]QKW39920.1 hypothetical protein HUT06_42690 [Actinomadura sp. NAK00032]
MLHFAAQERQLRCEATVLTKPISDAADDDAHAAGARIRAQMTTDQGVRTGRRRLDARKSVPRELIAPLPPTSARSSADATRRRHPSMQVDDQ